MTIVDGIILGITLMSAILGFSRGFAREVLNLASWACGGLLTYVLMPYVQGIARTHIENQMMADGATFLGLFIVFLILFNIASRLLSNFIRDSLLNGIDRSLGFLFGIGRSYILLCGIQIILSLFMSINQYPEILKTNRFLPFFVSGSAMVMQTLPTHVSHYIYTLQLRHSPNVSNGLAHIPAVAGQIASNIMDDLSKNMQKHPLTQQFHDANRSAQQHAEQIARLQPKIEATENLNQQDGVTVHQEKALDKFLNTQEEVVLSKN